MLGDTFNPVFINRHEISQEDHRSSYLDFIPKKKKSISG